jgi:hypothetical protein
LLEIELHNERWRFFPTAGAEITLYAVGTENVHWRTDAQGYPVVRNPANPDQFVYAVYDNASAPAMGGVPSM